MPVLCCKRIRFSVAFQCHWDFRSNLLYRWVVSLISYIILTSPQIFQRNCGARCVQSAFCVPWFTFYWPWVIIDCPQCFGCECIPSEVPIPDFCHGLWCHFALLLANECTTHIGRHVDAPYHSALSAFYWRCLWTQTWMALYWRTINRFSKLPILSGVRASGLFWIMSVT